MAMALNQLSSLGDAQTGTNFAEEVPPVLLDVLDHAAAFFGESEIYNSVVDLRAVSAEIFPYDQPAGDLGQGPGRDPKLCREFRHGRRLTKKV